MWLTPDLPSLKPYSTDAKSETLKQNTFIKNNVDNQKKIEAFILIAFVATIFSLKPQFV